MNELDELDRQLLRLLVADGRRSYTDLARDTGLSTSAVHQRVRRLEQRGVISGYTARVDPVLAGLPLTAFVSVTPIDPAAPDDAPDRLRHLPAVEACHSVAGTESWILKVRVAQPRRRSRPCCPRSASSAGVQTRHHGGAEHAVGGPHRAALTRVRPSSAPAEHPVDRDLDDDAGRVDPGHPVALAVAPDGLGDPVRVVADRRHALQRQPPRPVDLRDDRARRPATARARPCATCRS